MELKLEDEQTGFVIMTSIMISGPYYEIHGKDKMDDSLKCLSVCVRLYLCCHITAAGLWLAGAMCDAIVTPCFSMSEVVKQQSAMFFYLKLCFMLLRSLFSEVPTVSAAADCVKIKVNGVAGNKVGKKDEWLKDEKI